MKSAKIKYVSENDLKEFYRIYKDYTNGKMSLASLKRRYREFPNLFLGAYLKNKLIGIVFGLPSRNNKKEIILHSIAVLVQYWRKGIGSELLKRFFKECKKRGFTEISVGAGEGVERFYLKNGFKIRYLRVELDYKHESLFKKKFKESISKKVKRRTYVIFYLRVKDFDNKLRNKIKNEFGTQEIIFILERKL